jgi:hypothetical protein
MFKKSLLLVTLFMNLDVAMACSSFLEKYPRECAIQSKYNKLKKDYKDLGIDIENITFYRALRLIDKNDLNFETSKEENRFLPWEVYSPKPKTWLYWELGDRCRKDLILSKQTGSLTLDDLKTLHRQMIDSDILGAKKSFLATLKLVATPGNIRSGMNITSGELDYEMTPEQKKVIENFELMGTDGNPLFYANFFKPPHKKNYIAKTWYVKSSNVERELKAYLEEIGSSIDNYKEGKEMGQTPLEFVADIQRKYIAIHPFSEGNGRVSRMIQDFVLDKLDLPLIPAGRLQNDLYREGKLYREDTISEMNNLVDELSACLSEYQTAEGPSAKCAPAFKNYKNLDLPKSAEKKSEFNQIFRKKLLEVPGCVDKIEFNQDLYSSIRIDESGLGCANK